MRAARTGTGILCYSRSGHSKRAARRLADEVNGALIDIAAPAYAGKVLGYARAGFDSLRQRALSLPAPQPSVAGFERVIFCGPVWTSYPAVPLRALLRADLPLPDTVALFLTSGDHSPAQKAFDTAQADLSRPFAALGSLSNAAEGTKDEDRIFARFLDDLARSENLQNRD